MNIRRRMFRGAIWTVLYRLADRTLGLASTFVLAHLLMPADFGIVAMATSLIALLQLIAYFGLDIALLRQNDSTPDHFNCVWTLNVLCGCGIAALMLGLSIPAAHFYHEPRVTLVIATLAAAPFISGFENVGVIAFRKELRFDREFHFLFSKRLIKFVTTVAIALWLRTYWALIAGILIGRACGVLISYIVQPFRPRFSLRGVAELMHFSMWLMLHNFTSFLRDRSSDFVVGRLAGSSALGLFSVAAEISDLPGTELVSPINRAVMPAYMKIAHDLPALRREYVSVLSLVALVAIPAVAGVALCAPFMVLLFLGQKWAATADLIEILAFYGITRVIQSNAYSAYLALGKPQYFVGMTSICVAVLVSLLVTLTTSYGLHGAAWAYVIMSAISVPLDFYFITRFMGVRPTAYISSLWRPMCSAGLMYVVVRALGPAPPGGAILTAGQAAYSLVLCIAIGAPAYIICDSLCWLISGRPDDSAESVVFRKVREFWSRASSVTIG